MITRNPPSIPACYTREPRDAREHVMMWVHTGQAHVRLANGQEHRVDAGTGIWLPPGSDHRMWTEPGSLAFPTWISPHAVPGAPVHVARFTVEDAWREWLIAHFAHAYTTYEQVSPNDLVEVLTRSGPNVPQHTVMGNARRYPPIPRTTAARRVALELVRNRRSTTPSSSGQPWQRAAPTHYVAISRAGPA